MADAPEMHRTYARFYAAWTLGSVVMETFFPVTKLMRSIQLLSLLTVESIAVWVRKKDGDAYTEWIGRLTHDEMGNPLHARLAGAVGLMQYVTFCYVDLSVLWLGHLSIGVSILALTFDAWGTYHWWTNGRAG